MTSLLFNTLSRFVIDFLPISKHILFLGKCYKLSGLNNSHLSSIVSMDHESGYIYYWLGSLLRVSHRCSQSDDQSSVSIGAQSTLLRILVVDRIKFLVVIGLRSSLSFLAFNQGLLSAPIGFPNSDVAFCMTKNFISSRLAIKFLSLHISLISFKGSCQNRLT